MRKLKKVFLNHLYKRVYLIHYYNHMSSPQTIIHMYFSRHDRPYYRLKDQHTYYDMNFPLSVAFAASNDYGIGPETCRNCQTYGSINGIQFTVCGNCVRELRSEFKCNCNTLCIETEMNKAKRNGTNKCDVVGCGLTCLLNTHYKDALLDQIGLSKKHHKKRNKHINFCNIEQKIIVEQIRKIIKRKKDSESFQLKGHKPVNKHLYFTEDGTVIDIHGVHKNLYDHLNKMV